MKKENQAQRCFLLVRRRNNWALFLFSCSSQQYIKAFWELWIGWELVLTGVAGVAGVFAIFCSFSVLNYCLSLVLFSRSRDKINWHQDLVSMRVCLSISDDRQASKGGPSVRLYLVILNSSCRFTNVFHLTLSSHLPSSALYWIGWLLWFFLCCFCSCPIIVILLPY